MKKAAIEFIDFSFRYRSQKEPTLEHITLSIVGGEKVLIVGPSGSGKSTLGYCLNGLIPFYYHGESTGELRIAGQSASSLSIAGLAEQVGTVLQDTDGQFVGLTVGEDIAFKLENDAVPQAEMKGKVASAAAAVGLSDYLETSPQHLSGGQKQKTTLAGVLVGEADILLFDEPLASLDPQAGMQAMELIDRIHRDTGKTIVIIEHRLEDVLHCAVDRIIVMNEGKIAADLRPDELLGSGLLARVGIREPLYITALQYAGCRLDPAMSPARLERLPLERCAPWLRSWHEAQPEPADAGPFEPALELREITFGYEKGNPILRQVSLTAGKGEMLGIAGKNGAGKSTLMKLICGLLRPSSGSVRLFGRDLAADTIKHRAGSIGFVMQNPNQMISKPQLYDEVAWGLKNRGLGEEAVRERVYETLKICGLYEFRNWPIAALSYGQKKRATIASVLAQRPSVVILDEPTAGQDYRNYNEIMEFLRRLARQGITVIMITHDMHLLLEYADRAVILAEGLKCSDGRPEQVLADREVVRKAHLKETSLHELAARAGISEPAAFVRKFIAYDRRMRNT